MTLRTVLVTVVWTQGRRLPNGLHLFVGERHALSDKSLVRLKSRQNKCRACDTQFGQLQSRNLELLYQWILISNSPDRF